MVKTKREYDLSPVEFYKFQLNQIINHTVQVVTTTDITLVAYLHVYGESFQDQLLQDRIFINPISIKNAISKLVKLGFLVKENKQIKINPAIILVEEDFVQINIVRKDPSKTEVYHKYYKK